MGLPRSGWILFLWNDKGMKMSIQTRYVASSIAAIILGLAAFFAAGGIMFGAIYLGLVYLLPKPEDLLVFNLNLLSGLLVGEAAGSIVSGYVAARVARRAQFFHSAVVIALLCALRQGYIFWGSDTGWYLTFDPSLLTFLVCLPFFSFGTWMGFRKRKLIERSG
jgi:hypothetical protein